MIIEAVAEDYLVLGGEKRMWKGVDHEWPVPLIDWAISNGFMAVGGDHLVPD
jgi:hypothetical protein